MIILLLALTGASVCAAGSGNGTPLDADRVKAAFLFNFAKFVTWPESSSSSGPIVFGVVGPELQDLIDEAVAGKTVQGRTVVVRRLQEGDDLRGCHLLFIGASQERRTKDLLLKLQGTSVLTVGETQHFLREGGVIRFFVEENRVRFQIDTGRAERAGLRISSQLLSLSSR